MGYVKWTNYLSLGAVRLDTTCRRGFYRCERWIIPEKWFAKENENGAPVNALLITNILVQIFLIEYVVH